MSKHAISVTLDADNVTWLKGRAGAAGSGVSDLLNRIVTTARTSRHGGPSRSVVGTIDIDPADPELAGADEAVRAVFEQSLRRPLLIREPRPSYAAGRKTKRRRG